MSERELLVLRLVGPMVSFGGVKVDENNVIERFPGAALLTGLLGNALGWDHADVDRLDRLQERLRFASRSDLPGRRLVDFQTVDLGQPFLQEAWTTLDRPASRGGGSAKEATHIRRRHYWADSITTVVLDLQPPDEQPTLDDLEAALIRPERPLFIGRKACLPSEPLVVGRMKADSLERAIAQAPRHRRVDDTRMRACWPRERLEEEGDPGTRLIPVVDERDWANQVHVGRRWVWDGWVELEGASDG